MQSVDSAQNKELLWSTLQESGAFAGLTRDQFQPVQSAFDRSVQQAAAKSGAAVSLSDVNKHIIREFVQVLRAFQKPPPVPVPEKKNKLELVYRSEDIQNERASEFDRQLREKQAEMDSFLTLKKPTDVSFTDKMSEDKPIGDEMSRLIAQELAARERELVQMKPEDIKKAQQWIGANATNATNATNANPVKKTVSFSEEEEEEDDKVFEETASILSKFKPIQVQTQPPNSSITLQHVYEKLLELEQHMNDNHAEIMSYLKKPLA
jgi:hypothetical protein